MDLKLVLKNNPKCLESRSTLRSLLKDMYPKEKRTIHVLLDAYESGVVGKFRNLKQINAAQMESYITQLVDEYGLQRQYAQEGIEVWAKALNISIAKSVVPPIKPASPQKPTNPPKPPTPIPTPIPMPAPTPPPQSRQKNLPSNPTLPRKKSLVRLPDYLYTRDRKLEKKYGIDDLKFYGYWDGERLKIVGQIFASTLTKPFWLACKVYDNDGDLIGTCNNLNYRGTYTIDPQKFFTGFPFVIYDWNITRQKLKELNIIPVDTR